MPYHNLRTDNALNVSPDHVLQGISPFEESELIGLYQARAVVVFQDHFYCIV